MAFLSRYGLIRGGMSLGMGPLPGPVSVVLSAEQDVSSSYIPSSMVA